MTDLIKKEAIKIKPNDILIDNGGDIKKVIDVEDNLIRYIGGWGTSSIQIDEIKRGSYIHIPLPEGKTFEEYVDELDSDALSKIGDPKYLNREVGSNNSSTALVTSSGPDRLQASINSAEKAMIDIEIVKRLILRRVSQIESVYHDFKKQVEKWARILGVFELYLGIGENVVQIKSGENAPIENISIRQLVLFMDEEVGDITNGGIDFQSVEIFDEWVKNNYEALVPEPRCVVAMRPSRQKRFWYDRNGNELFTVASEDYNCYLLIRNGDNLYRIYTKLLLDEHFIPTQKELKRTMEQLEKDGFKKDNADKTQLYYARNALLVQGIIDRTEIFNIVERPDVMMGTGVDFIYDGEFILPDGHYPYKEWKQRINADIKRGSRILFDKTVAYRNFGRKGHDGRLKRHYNEHSIPGLPPTGVYTVEAEEKYKSWGMKEPVDCLIIKYNPGDTVYGNWYQDWHERKNRLSFRIYPTDDFVFNYDRITLEDIDFYINCRSERRHYLDILPLLWELKRERIKELEWEAGFVEMMKVKYEEDDIWKVINWWKHKNIWQRPLMEDDSKALRMIKTKLKNIKESKNERP